MSAAWLIALAVIAILVLRRMTETNLGMSDQARTEEIPESRTEDTAAARHKIEQDGDGTLDGEEYHVECLDGETWTVYIDCEELPKQFEVDARAGFPAKTWDAERDADVQALLKEGVNYLDVGYNTEWVAASLPINEKKVPAERAERIVRRLQSLRKLSA